MTKKNNYDEKTESQSDKEDRLLTAIHDACSELGWVISVNYKDNNNETLAGVILGEENFVGNAEILIFEHDEVSNFAIDTNQNGEVLIELKNKKIKGDGFLH